MKRTAYLILALLTLPAALTAGNLSVGLGYPYVSAKYDGGKLSAEARMVTGGGVQVYAGRGYWNFHRSSKLKGFTGLEAGYIRFDTLSMKGTGYEASLFIGGEYPVADNFYVLMDFAPTLIVLRHDLYTDVRVGGMEYVVNLGFYYRFGKVQGKAAPEPDKKTPEQQAPESKAAAEALPAAPVEVSTAAAPAAAPPQVSTAAAPSPEAVIDELIKQLDSKNWKERRKAAFELGKLKSPRAAEPLIGLLDDKNERVRGVAALALGRLDDPRALLPLMLTLADPSSYVRASVAKSLGQLKDKRALMDLEDAAKDPSEEVRKAAEEAIKKVKAAPQAKPGGKKN
ncbi:MAG TPA: hypothetical protein DCZ92_04580 [Elusimicrobia bacterium]|nr:hypothetical protein [Elusimicrobiota bacterium]